MKIAIIGWGSLVWDPRELNTEGKWLHDGPKLPLEFARISSDLRLTLVIRPKSKWVKTLYINSADSDLKSAISNLQEREKCPNINSIGYYNFLDKTKNIKRIPEEIERELSMWNEVKKYDAVIWTDLGQNFKDKSQMEFNVHNLKIHLAGLKSNEYQLATEYILNAPSQIKTNFRKQIEDFIKLRNEITSTLNSNTSFFNVPREKLMQFYPEVIANSVSQFQGANSLASIEKYGMGISHLLISTEEMIKALVIVMDAKGFEFRKIKGMDIFFKNHEIRFFIGFITFILTLFGEDGMKLVKAIKDNPSKTKELTLLIKNKQEMNTKLKWYFLRKLIIIRNELSWFSKAEAFRQNGFYVDAKGNLVSPLLYTSQDFKDTQLRIEKVNKTIQYCIDAFLSEEEKLVEAINETKQKFQSANYYSLIENELENRRNGKATFFDIFQKFLMEFIESIKSPPSDSDDFFKRIE